jgi:hypothetical protein
LIPFEIHSGFLGFDVLVGKTVEKSHDRRNINWGIPFQFAQTTA